MKKSTKNLVIMMTVAAAMGVFAPVSTVAAASDGQFQPSYTLDQPTDAPTSAPAVDVSVGSATAFKPALVDEILGISVISETPATEYGTVRLKNAGGKAVSTLNFRQSNSFTLETTTVYSGEYAGVLIEFSPQTPKLTVTITSGNRVLAKRSYRFNLTGAQRAALVEGRLQLLLDGEPIDGFGTVYHQGIPRRVMHEKGAFKLQVQIKEA